MRRVLVLALASLAAIPIGFAQSKRPMTFDDMMAMKRLGETAVSPDGGWLAYSVTTVDLAQNTKTPELWLQKISGGDPIKLAVGQPDDADPEFSPDGHSVLFLSGRENGQQVWLADFDPATGATSNPHKLTNLATEAGSPKWSPDGRSIVFTSAVYPDCAPITASDFATGNQCNADRDKALAESKVKAQIWTHLLYRHWNHYTGDKRSHLFLVSVDTGAMRDLNPGDPHDVPPFSLEDSSCGCDISPDGKELAFTENPDPVPAISISAQIYTLDLTDPAAKPVKVSTSAGGNFNPAYSPDGKYLAWRSEARAGYESDKFRLVVLERVSKSAGQQAGGPTVRDLLPKFDNWVDEFAWGPTNSSVIYFTSPAVGGEPVFAVNVIDGKPNPKPASLTDDGGYSDLHPTPNGRSLLADRVSVRAPSEVIALDSAWVGHTLFDVIVLDEND
jgi:Tol biopolymer transport system component